VLFVSEEAEMFNEPPDREEAGSPNVVGAVAMAAAARFIERDLGWEWLIDHERDLTSYALEHLNTIPNLTVYGPDDPALPEDRLGVICFNLAGVDHRLTASILGTEYGIGTRSGCFCAHPYLIRLFGVSQEQVQKMTSEIACGDKRHMPGALRMSFGFYNTRDDVDAAISALRQVSKHKWRGTYHQEKKSGEFFPEETKAGTAGWFTL
jgi:selenocysteine lyase/cysteine desulfurase